MDHAYSQLSDAELAGLLKAGNQLAFAQIYERYWRVITGMFIKCCWTRKKQKT